VAGQWRHYYAASVVQVADPRRLYSLSNAAAVDDTFVVCVVVVSLVIRSPSPTWVHIGRRGCGASGEDDGAGGDDGCAGGSDQTAHDQNSDLEETKRNI
jgi:hypothetical protein